MEIMDRIQSFLTVQGFRSKMRGRNNLRVMEKLTQLLKQEITDHMPLEEIVNVFERMCGTPVEDDHILFETGTFDFTGEPLFYFSLVRQAPDGDDEYYQIHVDVLYKPTEENHAFSEATWDDELDESIFDYIRESKAFAYGKNREYVKVGIYLGQT